MRPTTRVRLLIAALAALGAGCLYHANERCGPGETVDEAGVCVCSPGTVPVYRDITVLVPVDPNEQRPFSACVPCGANEVVSGAKCACAPGFVRGASGCAHSNLGSTCASAADCAGGDQTFCRLPEGYCTKMGCAANADCNGDADYACATKATPSFCKRPPLRQGAACTMMGPDPACSQEAPLCVQNACTAAGCMTDADCSPSRKCCDLTKFGQAGLTLCLPGACP
jgi:hypothetical protein